MATQLDQDEIVRRRWLPAFAIFWICLSSVLVFVRLSLRITGRNAALGLDDVCASVLLARQAANKATGSTHTVLDRLHTFHKCCNLLIECRIH